MPSAGYAVGRVMKSLLNPEGAHRRSFEAIAAHLFFQVSFLGLPGVAASSLLFLQLLQLGLQVCHLTFLLLHLLACVAAALVRQSLLHLGGLGGQSHLLLVELVQLGHRALQVLPDAAHAQLHG